MKHQHMLSIFNFDCIYLIRQNFLCPSCTVERYCVVFYFSGWCVLVRWWRSDVWNIVLINCLWEDRLGWRMRCKWLRSHVNDVTGLVGCFLFAQTVLSSFCWVFWMHLWDTCSSQTQLYDLTKSTKAPWTVQITIWRNISYIL